MYILKPENGFVIPVIYVQNEMLYINNSIDIQSNEDERNNNTKGKRFLKNYEEEKTRDRLFSDDDELDFIKKEIKENELIYNLDEKNEAKLGTLVFDDMEDNNSENKDSKQTVHVDTRTSTEIIAEEVGKLTIDKIDDKGDIKVKNSGKDESLEKSLNVKEKDSEEVLTDDFNKDIRVSDKKINEVVEDINQNNK